MRSLVLTCSFALALTGTARAQADRNGANMRATEQAWARTLEFIRQNTK
jgi:hypothetical protein